LLTVYTTTTSRSFNALARNYDEHPEPFDEASPDIATEHRADNLAVHVFGNIRLQDMALVP
jgi:hypothetical protein